MDNSEEEKKESYNDLGQPTLAEMQKETKQQWVHFLEGFLGWFILYGLLWLGIMQTDLGYFYIANLLLLPLNIIVMIILAVKKNTRLIGFGVLTAMAANIFFALIAGAGEASICNIPFFVLD